MEVDGSDHFPFFSWVICRFQPLIFQGVVWKTIHFQVRALSFREGKPVCFHVDNNPMLFPNVFFLVFTRGLHGDYQDSFNQPVGLFLELLPKKEPSEWRRSKCNSPKKNHEVSIPQSKARSVRWELSKL